MTWIALADRQSHDLMTKHLPDGPLPRGTLLIETRVSPQKGPQQLLTLTHMGKRESYLSIQAVPGGGIHFLFKHGDAITHCALGHDAEDQADVLRINYAWDVDQGTGHFTIERPGMAKVFRHVLRNPLPLTATLLRSLVFRPNNCHMAKDLIFAAVADSVEPIGPMPAICATAPVLSSNGVVPAGHLKRGDLVKTVNGDLVPVLHVLRHTLPARGSFAPVRLRAPYFGLKRDVVVTPEARLVVGGTRVEYLFGAENVLVPVKHLTSGASARVETCHKLVTYVQLLLPDHEALMVGGTAIESLNIGRIRRKRDLLPATLLGQFADATLPEHSKSAFPVLKHFESVTLADHRAA